MRVSRRGGGLGGGLFADRGDGTLDRCGRRLRWCGWWNGFERGLQMDDLGLLGGGGLLELVGEGAAAVVEAGEGLVEGGHLVGRGGEAGGGVDAEDYVV